MDQETVVFLSFVIPVKDEEATLRDLANGIFDVVAKMPVHYDVEIIFIDDGSNDRSWEIMTELVNEFQGKVLALRLRRNFGKAIALEAGFRKAKGDIVFTMDADLQDDPAEIPAFLDKLKSGFDMVSGWKRNRQDPSSKTLPSRLFNKVTAFVTGIFLHDFNCGYKAYRREVISSVRLYGELHRYIPVLANDAGFRVGEIEVRHHPRRYGTSKYGWERYARGLLDLFTVLATTRWLQKPGHLFGGIGLFSGLLGFSVLIYLSVLWFLGLGPIGTRPLFFLGLLLIILSIQMISFGLLAEFIVFTSNTRKIDKVIAEEYFNE